MKSGEQQPQVCALSSTFMLPTWPHCWHLGRSRCVCVAAPAHPFCLRGADLACADLSGDWPISAHPSCGYLHITGAQTEAWEIMGLAGGGPHIGPSLGAPALSWGSPGQARLQHQLSSSLSHRVPRIHCAPGELRGTGSFGYFPGKPRLAPPFLLPLGLEARLPAKFPAQGSCV